jgi:predicted enzyme related to lactoylglutathione lyase
VTKANNVGKVGWLDITVKDAPALRDFYSAVVGWIPTDVSMGDYSDYGMTMPGNGEAVSGVCHARGSNADLPPQWLIYIVVADLDASLTACRDNGGNVLREPKDLAGGRFAIITDPVGAVTALYQEP